MNANENTKEVQHKVNKIFSEDVSDNGSLRMKN